MTTTVATLRPTRPVPWAEMKVDSGAQGQGREARGAGQSVSCGGAKLLGQW